MNPLPICEAEAEANPDLRKELRKHGDEETMGLAAFRRKWSQATVSALQEYCVEQEYDLDAISEDLDSFEEEGSMIVEELEQRWHADASKSRSFVQDLRRLISTDPATVKSELSATGGL